MGSYRLKCHTKGSGDLDLCCVGPENISFKEFSESFLKFISKEKIKESRIVEDALFPVLKLKIEKLSIDIQYAGIKVEKEIPNYLLELKKIKSTSMDCINGVRDIVIQCNVKK
jgi:poly(A) polymerase Pap1